MCGVGENRTPFAADAGRCSWSRGAALAGGGGSILKGCPVSPPNRPAPIRGTNRPETSSLNIAVDIVLDSVLARVIASHHCDDRLLDQDVARSPALLELRNLLQRLVRWGRHRFGDQYRCCSC